MRIAICALFLLVACADVNEMVRASQEQEAKVRRNHESICFARGVKSLDLFYNGYTTVDLQDLRALRDAFHGNAKNLELPQLSPDLLRHIAQKTGRFRDNPELEEALRGPVNEALNSRLPLLNAGTYNTIYVRIGQVGYLGITPAMELGEFSSGLRVNDLSAAIYVWVPEPLGKDLVRTVLENTTLDSLWAFDGRGNLLSTRDGSLDIAIVGRSTLSSKFADYVRFPPNGHPARCTSQGL
jgi:hypothetical protein